MPRKNYEYFDVECKCCHQESIVLFKLEYDGDGGYDWMPTKHLCPKCRENMFEECNDIEEAREMIKKIVKEEILRGVPDFVISDAADEACNYLRTNLYKGINQRSLSGAEKRSMLKIMNKMLKELKDELHERIRDKVDALKHEL